MDIKSIALCALTLVLSTNLNAALITNLYNLNINGTNYDVTFHTGVGTSFSALWDADNDALFGGGASVFDTAPTFWGDSEAAFAATNAIIIALGDADTTTVSGSDSFFIPVSAATKSGQLTTNDDSINVYTDSFLEADSDTSRAAFTTSEYTDTSTYRPYATFNATTVPVPGAVWLFGSGLLGLIGVARRKVRV